MMHAIMLAILFVYSGHSWAANQDAPKQKKHEAAEDKARIVPGGASKGVTACHADIERFCKNVKPGEGRIGACLFENARKLSKGCRRWAAHGGEEHIGESLIKDIDGAPTPAREPEDSAKTVPGGASKGAAACHADIERFCKNVKPGEGRVGACLFENSRKLSERCRRWAAHGGKEHIGESLIRDIDGAPVPAQ